MSDTYDLSHVFPVAIIGAGPAGLSLGYELKKRSIPCIILEKGTSPGNSWSDMPSRLHLITPWNKSSLFDSSNSLRSLFAFRSAKYYHQYLNDQASRLELPIKTGFDVQRLNKTEAGIFEIFDGSAEAASIRSQAVVNATGYYDHPYIPRIPGLDASSIPFLHARDYKDPSQVLQILGNSGKRVMIVGKRVTAGQIAWELHSAGFQISLSVREPVTYARRLRSFLSLCRAQVYYIKEDWLATNHPETHKPSFPPMQGGPIEEAIEKQAISVLPEIDSLESDTVVFRDGHTAVFDLIILATGYRPALTHLKSLDPSQPSGFESVAVENLFFLGYDQQRSFRSRYLRGIKEDAAILANLLEKRHTEP